MGVLPAVWLLPVGSTQPPRPVGALVRQACPADGPVGAAPGSPQQLLLSAAGRTGLEPSLHLSVYAAENGCVLEQRLDLQRSQGAVFQHPGFGVPAWDSG